MSAAVPPRSEGTDVTDNKTFLGTEPVGNLLRKLAVPTVIAQLVNMLYNIVDRIYIGHMPGDGSLALTGVGVCLPIIMVISAFAALISSGGAPRASIAMGRGDMETAQKLLGGCFMLQVAISAVLTAVLLVWSRDLLLAFGASANTIDYAADYMRVYAMGTLFVQLTLGMNAFITAQGFAKVGMTTVLIGAAANIVLDPVFIFALGMGVRGAALATILSQGLSCVWVLRFLTGKRTLLRLRRANFFIPARLLLPCISLGLATFVMQASESVISICFNSSLLKYGGDIAVGAMTIITSATQLLSMPVQGLCQGAQPIMSFNFGAGKGDRVKQAFRLQFIICVAYAAAFWAACMLVPQMFASIFSTDPELVRYTAWAMRVYMAGIFSTGFQVSCQQSFVALGQAKISLFMACLRKLILLIPLIFILPLILQDKVFAVFLAEPVSDIIAATVTCSAFFIRFNKILATSQKKA